MFIHKEIWSETHASPAHDDLVSYIASNPDRLSTLEKSVNGFPFIHIKKVCDSNPLLSAICRDAIEHARTYASHVLRIEELSACTKTDSACREEWDMLVEKQSKDKDLFIQSLKDLYEEMQEAEITKDISISPFLDRGSVFNSQLALYVAFKSLS